MGDKAQFPGWPIKVAMDANDGRKVVGYLPEIVFDEGVNGVVQVIEEKPERFFTRCVPREQSFLLGFMRKESIL